MNLNSNCSLRVNQHRNRPQARKVKSARGAALLFLMVMIIGFIFIPVGIFAFHCIWLVQQRSRIQGAFDGASLLAAKDISNLFIHDPAFGLVGISNFPPIGKATIAADGEPLPVWGINDLVGTIRLNTVLARQLQSDTYLGLASLDHEQLNGTIDDLNTALISCLKQSGGKQFTTIDGVTIKPLNDVQAFMTRELTGIAKIDSLELSNGWLSSGGRTLVNAPDKASVSGAVSRDGEYKPFVDIPQEGMTFTFAAVAKSPSLVDSGQFRHADKHHICSAVRVLGSVEMRDPLEPIFGRPKRILMSACAVPCSLPNMTPAGAMTLRFPQGFLPEIGCLMDLLSDNNAFSGAVKSYDTSGGDYPVDRGSQLTLVSSPSCPGSSASMFAESLYYWLRNGHCTPTIEAILATLQQPFDRTSARSLIYEFERNGTISVKTMLRDPFAEGTISDQQSVAEFEGQSNSGILCSFYCRNQTKNLGAVNGGKHQGQPLVGYPIDWCEQSEFAGDAFTALTAGKGRLISHLTVNQSAIPASQAITLATFERAQLDTFQLDDGTYMSQQPRRSVYSGGLATDIEIQIVRKPFLLRRMQSRKAVLK